MDFATVFQTLLLVSGLDPCVIIVTRCIFHRVATFLVRLLTRKFAMAEELALLVRVSIVAQGLTTIRKQRLSVDHNAKWLPPTVVFVLVVAPHLGSVV